MKTQLKTDTYQIAITDIDIDSGNPSNFEISFETTLKAKYLRATEYFTDGTAAANDDTACTTTYELNVAHRHDSGLYYIIQNDRNGDSFDDINDAIRQFGKPVIDFVSSACKLLNIPFFASH